MNKPEIITVPNLQLSEPTKQIGSFELSTKDWSEQLKNMTEALRSYNGGGVGLAANQLGYLNRAIVVEYDDPENKDTIPFQVFINPEIVDFSIETNCLDEGCLSVPPIELPVVRSLKIKVKAQNEHGKRIKMTAKGLLARILQHEIDHLNGILFTDRVKDKFLKDNPELKNKKIIFIGSDQYAEPILKGLILLGLNISLVITETPKPAGRSKTISPTIVSQIAKSFNKNLLETSNITENINDIQKIDPDLIILTDFGQLIPEEILSIPKMGAINIHPSILPKYRGATPIQTALLNGDKETGVSIMKMTPEFDKGPILAQAKVDILDEDTAPELEKRLSVVGLKLLFETLPRFFNNQTRELPQDDGKASYTKKIKKEDGEIDWNKKPQEINNLIRAFNPWPGAFTFIGEKRIIIRSAEIKNEKLNIKTIQPEGKNQMAWKDFLRGYNGTKPDWFEKIS